MKRVILLLTILSSFAFSVIDECKTDVYFGNGILTEEEDAEKNARLLKDALIETLGLESFQKKIGKVDYAYNRTDGMVIDLLESLMQKIDGTMIEKIHKATEVVALLAGLLTQQAHDADLKTQIEQYEKSIKSGHRVLVVAHSQGSLGINIY